MGNLNCRHGPQSEDGNADRSISALPEEQPIVLREVNTNPFSRGAEREGREFDILNKELSETSDVAQQQVLKANPVSEQKPDARYITQTSYQNNQALAGTEDSDYKKYIDKYLNSQPETTSAYKTPNKSQPTAGAEEDIKNITESPDKTNKAKEGHSPSYLPNRSALIDSINQSLRKSVGRENLLASPSKVVIHKDSSHLLQRSDAEAIIRQKYDDGSFYEGYSRDGVRHGKGKLYYPNGMVYEGQFVNGLLHGKGLILFASGKICYEGEFVEDKFKGHGILHNESPDQFEQPFDYRNFNELGNLWMKYDGSFFNDMKNGIGTLYLINGERFYGEFVDDKIHGKGYYYMLNGESMSGQWKDNELIEHYD